MLSTFFTRLAEDYTYETTSLYYDDTTNGMSSVFIFFFIALGLLLIASMWRIFTKAGRPGWAAIVPIYNSLQLIWTVGKPWWWLLLLCIPFVNIVVAIMLMYYLAQAFGKGMGFTLLLIFLPMIGYPMLAWGDAQYRLKAPRRR